MFNIGTIPFVKKSNPELASGRWLRTVLFFSMLSAGMAFLLFNIQN